MQNLILTQITLPELKQAISEVLKEELRSELQALKPAAGPTDLLTRKQAAKLLGVSLPTLHKWGLIGKVPQYRIRNCVRYKRAEVEHSLTQIEAARKVGYNA